MFAWHPVKRVLNRRTAHILQKMPAELRALHCERSCCVSGSSRPRYGGCLVRRARMLVLVLLTTSPGQGVAGGSSLRCRLPSGRSRRGDPRADRTPREHRPQNRTSNEDPRFYVYSRETGPLLTFFHAHSAMSVSPRHRAPAGARRAASRGTTSTALLQCRSGSLLQYSTRNGREKAPGADHRRSRHVRPHSPHRMGRPLQREHSSARSRTHACLGSAL